MHFSKSHEAPEWRCNSDSSSAYAMERRNVCCTTPQNRSNGVPAEAFALLFGYFLEYGQRLRTSVLAAGGEDGVDERNGRGIRSAKRSGLDAGEKYLVAFAGERRNISVRDADAVGAAGARQVHAFNRLAETATKADGQDKVALIDGANEVSDA